MSKTPEGRSSSADVENNSENPSAFRKIGQAAVRAAGAVRDIVRTAKNRNGFAERLGINTENKNDLATGADVDSAAAEGILSSDSSTESGEKDSREGSSNGLTPKQIEALRRDARAVVISNPEEQISDNTEDASGSSVKKNIPVSEPPKPTLEDIIRNKWKDYKRDAAAKRSVLVHSTTEEDLGELESFGVDIDSSSVKPVVYSPEEVSRYKDENVINEEMFRTTIPNVDKPEKNDNPEGLTPYEQAMRDKYLGNEYDEAEYGDDEPKKDDNPEGLTPYEQFMRDKYFSNKYDETEYGDDKRSEVEPENKANTEKTEMSVDEHEAAALLKVARERFAKASIAVETHFFKEHFGGKKRQAELEAATKQLKQSELEYMRIKFADEIEAAKQDVDKQAELAAEIAQAVFANAQETSKRTSEKYNEMLDGRNKFKKYAAKVGEWFTKGGKVSQWLKLGGAGFAVGTTTAAFAGWPITTATLVATKLAVAGALKQNILEERRGEDRIAKNRPDYLDSSFAKDMAGKEADYVMNRAVDMSVDELKDVSVKRQEDLYRRIGSGLVKYTIGFGLGGLAGNWLSSTYATGDSVPKSGGKAVDTRATHMSPNSTYEIPDDHIPTSSTPIPEVPDVSKALNFDSYDYPWNWAAEKFGDANAMDQLHNLADKAMADGHTVRWLDGPGGTWMEVDGLSDTPRVLEILGKYV